MYSPDPVSYCDDCPSLGACSGRPCQKSRWTPVTESLPENEPGGWLIANRGRVSFTNTLPAWWNFKDGRGPEFDGPVVTHWIQAPKAP